MKSHKSFGAGLRKSTDSARVPKVLGGNAGPKHFKDGGACMAERKNGGKWIASATQNKGGLHRALGVPEGKKIPAAKLSKAAHSSSPKVRKEASLAKTLKSFH